jgi:hypothetical protein
MPEENLEMMTRLYGTTEPTTGDVDEENSLVRPSVVPDSLQGFVERTAAERAGIPVSLQPAANPTAYRKLLGQLCETFAGEPEFFKWSVDVVDQVRTAARSGLPLPEKLTEEFVK